MSGWHFEASSPFKRKKSFTPLSICVTPIFNAGTGLSPGFFYFRFVVLKSKNKDSMKTKPQRGY
jgi:hypothetical protein